MTAGKAKQLGLVILMIAVTFVGWLIVDPTCDNVFPINCERRLRVSLLAFFATLTLWNFLLCFWRFPEPTATNDLVHSTPSWERIAEDRCLFPTADARIYLVDQDVDLGKKASTGTNTKIVLSGAKTNGIAEPASFGPWEYLRFKTARGEWITAPYHLLIIDKYHAGNKSNEIIVTEYHLMEIMGKARFFLWLRRMAASFFLSPLLHSFLIAVLTFESLGHTASSFADLTTLWVIVGIVLLFGIWFWLQRVFNRFVFKAARQYSSVPNKTQS